jgi:predicted transcriptional regulator
LRRKAKNTKKKVKRKSTAPVIRNVTATPPDHASREAVRDILNRLFDNSAEELVKSLADSNQLTPEEMGRMNEVFGRQTKQEQRKK